MTDYVLRPARREDQRAIRALIHEAGINPTGLQWPRFVVAFDAQDRVIGCAQIKPHRDGSRELASVAVAPAYRRRGIAAALIRQLMHDCEPPLYLVCREGLASWYRQFGFERLATEAEMPPYFRRLHRVVSWLSRLRPSRESLAVMTWQAAHTGDPARVA